MFYQVLIAECSKNDGFLTVEDFAFFSANPSFNFFDINGTRCSSFYGRIIGGEQALYYSDFPHTVSHEGSEWIFRVSDEKFYVLRVLSFYEETYEISMEAVGFFVEQTVKRLY